MRIKVFSTLFLLILHYACYAQTTGAERKSAPVLLDEQKELQQQIVPLDSILELAVNNSPSVKFQNDLIEAAKSQLEFSKKQWSNNVVGFVNYSAGNQSIVSADSQSPGTQTSSNVTNGLRVGVQVNLPLFELLGRKSQTKIYKHDLNSTINKKDESIQELKKEVILQYYNLLYSSNLLAIRSDAKQSTTSEYAIAEKQFRDGIIDLGELSRLKTIEVNARADYEEAKRQFSTYYNQFEVLVGVPFQQLILKR
ncbi:outer membrane efflux protein [Mucilaginibacter frigoritolerans]|jgi:outer membrane protein TolC|uniref:Outer membrane efflux protein n=1 Tax=Mucilaginibacter frigoritolerans TaxID=652788 RepID=A0A562TQR6_9SPHI|nr:TolC family protein [Mucilaginibacter frigoritolerans]TWI95534.1 outer membrane efflux protein [Mucilaginibacter frigoritolerans]